MGNKKKTPPSTSTLQMTSEEFEKLNNSLRITGEIAMHERKLLPDLPNPNDVADVLYKTVPPLSKQSPEGPVWLVQFRGLGSETVGLRIVGDVILGRRSEKATESNPDIDFADYEDLHDISGVSRKHALMRPTPNRLYLLDLNSTNGTRVNGIPVNQSRAHILEHGDTLSFGNVLFVLHIIDQHQAKQ